MKITHFDTIPVRVPIKPELAIRSGRGGSHLVSPFLLVRLHTDAGIIGLGEVSCTPRWSGEDQVTAAHFIDAYFAPLLINETVGDVQQLYRRFASPVAGNYFTKAAIEVALWDIVGKAQSKPVWQIAGAEQEAGQHRSDAFPPKPDSVPTKWSVSGVEPEQAAQIAAWAAAQGFRAMKVKVGFNPDDDLVRVRAVREAVGPNIKLGIDANGGWATPEVAVRIINRLCDESDIRFAEQPVPAGDHHAMAEVRRNVPVPIIADESIYTLSDAMMLARAAAADVFSIYVGKAGGIGQGLEIARFAQAVGIKCTIGSNLELGVGTAAMIQLALSSGAFDVDNYPCDIIGPLFYEDDVLADPLHLSGGRAEPPGLPGLGVQLCGEKIERYRVR